MMKYHMNKYMFNELVTISQKVNSKSIKYKTFKLCTTYKGNIKCVGFGG